MVGARLATPADGLDVATVRSEALDQIAAQRDGELFLASDVAPDGAALIADAIARERLLALVVGVVGSAIVGYGVVRLESPKAELIEIFTLPSCRGVGVGDAILSVAQDLARAEGCTHLDSLALPGDRNTKNFFEAHGMKARLITTSGRL